MTDKLFAIAAAGVLGRCRNSTRSGSLTARAARASTCEHWCDYAALYEDPLEPDDVGRCYNNDKVSGIDDTCDGWEERTQ